MRRQCSSLSHPDCVILDPPQYCPLGLVPGAMPGPHKALKDCLLVQTMDRTFSVNVFKTHTVVRYNYFELERRKMKYNSKEKGKNGTKVRDLGAGTAGKRMSRLSRGDTMKTRRRPSTSKNEDLERAETRKPKAVNKSAGDEPSATRSASERRQAREATSEASDLRALLPFTLPEMFNWPSVVDLESGACGQERICLLHQRGLGAEEAVGAHWAPDNY